MANRLGRLLNDMDSKHLKIMGVLSIVLVSVGYALSPVLVIWISLVFPGPGQVVVRSVATATLLLLFLLSTTGWPKWSSLKSRKSKFWFAWYLLALPFGQFLFVLAMLYGGANAGPAALFYLSVGKILLTYILKNAKALLRPEKLLTNNFSRLRLTCVAMAVLAVWIYSWPGPLIMTLPMLAALGAGAVEAVSSLATGNLNAKDDKKALVFYRYGAASFVSLALVLALRLGPTFNVLPAVSIMALSIGALVVVALIQAFLGMLENYAYHRVPEDMANVILTTELIWGVMFSVWLINNVVNMSQLVGLALILFSALLAGYVASVEKKKVNDEN